MSGQFPSYPIHGQEYIDIFNVRWIYTTENEWVKVGPIITVPVAKSGDECKDGNA